MKKFLTTILLISLISVESKANEVINLEKGSPAPYTGLLFPKEKALDLRKELLELDNLKLRVESYEKSISLYKKNEEIQEDKIELLLKQNDKLAKALYESKDRSDFEKVLWFSLGLVVMGAGVYIGSQAVK